MITGARTAPGISPCRTSSARPLTTIPRIWPSKNYFSHNLSNGDSAEKNIERFGYTNWSFIGENIAAGQETARR